MALKGVLCDILRNQNGKMRSEMNTGPRRTTGKIQSVADKKTNYVPMSVTGGGLCKGTDGERHLIRWQVIGFSKLCGGD